MSDAPPAKLSGVSLICVLMSVCIQREAEVRNDAHPIDRNKHVYSPVPHQHGLQWCDLPVLASVHHRQHRLPRVRERAGRDAVEWVREVACVEPEGGGLWVGRVEEGGEVCGGSGESGGLWGTGD